MSVRHVFLASVSAVFLAASAAASGSAGAATQNPNLMLTQAAYKSLAAGDAGGAAAAYTRAIESRELEPEVLANALLNRALAYQRLEQPQLAIDDYTAALRLDAMSGQLRATALYNRALSYQKIDRPALAIEDYTAALFLDSSFAYAYYGRANVLRDSGQYLFALSDYDKALQHKYPEPARVYYGQALTYEALQRPQNAREALTRSLAANAQFTPARQKLAALDGGQAAPALPVLAAASTSPGGTLVARKSELPAAEQPPAELLGEQTASISAAPVNVASAEAPSKKYQDRVPTEEDPITTASITPPAQEKVIAVEPLPDTATEAPEVTAASDAPAEADAPSTDDAAASPVQSGWSVQIASAGSEQAAWSTWKKLQKGHRVLADKKPVVVKADLGNKGTFYRIRLVGFDEQGAAQKACSKLKSGGVKCYVSKADS